MSLEAVDLDLRRVFAPGQAYVGLSRVSFILFLFTADIWYESSAANPANSS